MLAKMTSDTFLSILALLQEHRQINTVNDNYAYKILLRKYSDYARPV